MDHLSIIPDSTSRNEDQREYGFFIEKGKYFTMEYKKEDSVKKEISNFVMESLFHLVNGTNNSKRIIKIQRNTGEICIVEVYSAEMKPDTFETILKSKRCTFLGSTYHLKKIFSRLMDTEIEAIVLSLLGWNHEHEVYVFADSVYFQSEILKINQIGIIETNGKRFYLPAFGLANNTNEDYETEKLYLFKPGTLNFSDWSKLFYDCFGVNGAVGILFLILAVFSDIVFSNVRFMPFLFLFGDFGTGKTSFVERLLSVFGSDIIGTSLNNATSIALSRLASSRVNSLFYFKEYTEETDEKTQDFILSAYDRAGRTTGIKSNDSKTKTFPVRSALIFDGNNLPSQKSAVLSRMILLNFEDSSFTPEQVGSYNRLKVAAGEGLGNVLLEILSKREVFEKGFKSAFSENASDLKSLYPGKYPERMINHIALLMAPAKILWTTLKFPFDFIDTLKSIIQNADNQNELLKRSGAISVFWESFSNMLKKGFVIKFDGYNINVANFNIKEQNNVIQIKYPGLYSIYVRYCRDNNIKSLEMNSLKLILISNSNKSFVPAHQRGRSVTYTDKNFGSCYQFIYNPTENGFTISDVEINL